MKILIVTPVYPPPPGGIQTLTKNLETGLSSLNHDITILEVPRSQKNSIKDFVPRLLLDRPRDIPEWPYFNRIFRKSNNIIQKIKPDIVHGTLVDCWPALEAAKREEIPTVVSTHALELSSSRHARSACSRADHVHAVSEFTSNLTSEVANISDKKIKVIHPSIKIPNTIPDPTPDGPVFSLARLTGRKNIENLIKAWKLLPRSLRQKHGLLIGGDGEEKTKLKRMTDGEPTIELMGRISEEKKKKMFSDASIFALTPLRDGFDVEGFGIVYIEAQSYGTPVIGSSTGGIPEAVGDAGMLVESPRDPHETADVLKKMLTDNATMNHCYQNIRDRINKFDNKSIAQEHLKSYQDII